jgi:hypothetical protein
MGASSLALTTMLLLGASALPPDVIPLRDRKLMIPVVINANRRSEIRELLLFTSVNRGQTWEQQAIATPDKEAFTYFAPADGVYWFSVVVVTQDNRREPADLNQSPPGLKVLIDTTPPTVKIRSADRVGDEIAVAWEIQENLPDSSSLRLEYRSAGDASAVWTPVSVRPDLVGQARFRPASNGAVVVRVQIKDEVGNPGEAVREVLATAGGSGGIVTTNAATQGPPALPPVSPIGGPNPVPVSPPMIPTEPGPTIPAAPVASRPLPQAPPTVVEAAPVAVPPPVSAPREIQPVVNQSPASVATSPLPAPIASNRVPVPHHEIPPANKAVNNTWGPENKPAVSTTSTGIQLVNSTQIGLAYEVVRRGPSGVSVAQLWVTQNNGQTWRMCAEQKENVVETKDGRAQIVAALPGEGVYGFRLVLASGAGLSKGQPMSGDSPEYKIEVDTTPPHVELYPPENDPTHRNTLILKWIATDRNIAPTGLSLEWADREDGQWYPIATGLAPQSGVYHWQLPSNLPYRVFLRVTARDLAGNIGVATTPKPELIDLHKPEGRLIGIISTVQSMKP